ncbi:uncharacterized protein DNG_05590 [Cephalotrichum gorgonifer]|uniref:Uncharacterized protein n=1 Tax=Cephalotrichum gorgonifer TaxID=2041049 RepID=A0AAE8SWE0_9PEZI|nr:uncharacterized protein DNG_05590 [Cephalotrichum gorgonifer]
MCIYVLTVPLCGHSPALLFGPSCPAVFSELGRINEPAAWEPPGLYRLPFRLPDGCLPHRENIAVVRSADFCAGCRDEFGQGGYACERGAAQGGETLLGRWPGMGRDVYDEPGRSGIGWRM